MNKADLISRVAEDTNMSKTMTAECINSVIGCIGETLKDGNKVSLTGFGTFTMANRKARMGRNPQTGAEIKIPSKNVVKFKPGKDLNETVN
ncbi:MAG: HU family DNA-binding protein [Saprospiraceae bacterium]